MPDDPLALWAELPFPRTLLWDDAGWMAAGGVAWSAVSAGPGRGVRLARALGRLEGAGAQPWVLGALAFEERVPATSPWGELAGARLWLPQRLVVRRGVAVEQVHAGAAVARAEPAAWPAAHDDLRELVEDATALIRDGAFRKVVLARAVDHALPAGFDLLRLVRQLREQVGQGNTVYAHELADGAVFVGATPELLVEVEGARVRTHALAGTSPAIDDDLDAARIAELVSSTKNRKEQGLVVEHLVEALRPRCKPFSVPASPGVRRAGGLIHLETRISCELIEPDHLDVIAALHPTPAVCGLPRRAAGHWLARHERLVRGLYGGALGWLGPGQARAVVPLRGALIAPDRSRARLFAGAGIVETSEPEAEWQETELKLGLMRRALGC